MPAKGSYRTAGFVLDINGENAGYLQAFEGGNIYAEVIAEQRGSDGIQKKHIGAPQYGDITLKVGMSMGQALYDWIKATLNRQTLHKNGSILTVDSSGKVRDELQFFNALITEVNFPASDAGSKEPAYLTILIKPEYIRMKPGSGQTPPSPVKKQKRWLSSNFRLTLGSLPCSRVAKIETFTINQQVTEGQIGERRDDQIEPTSLEFPNLTITLAAADALDWSQWFEDFVIKGNNADDNELSGSLTWLAADLKTELAVVTLSHVGIFGLAPEMVEAGSEQIRRIVVDLYCEQMAVEFKG